MVAKCVRKHMLVIIELLIPILPSVQANDHAPTSLPSLPPIQPPYFSELDGEIYYCLFDEIEDKCLSIKSTWPFPDFEYETCVYLSLKHCLLNFFHEDPQGYCVIESCIRNYCIPRLKIRANDIKSVRFVSCLLECYEEHLKKSVEVKSS